MEEAVQHFVEKWGLMCEKEGMARSSGRIFGYLLATGETLPLDEIADRLQVSKASVSTNARMLEQLGMVERVGVLGDRRDFYRAESDPWERMLRVAQQRWRDMLHVFADAAQSLPAEEARRRAANAERFHALLIEECDKVIERWHRMRDDELAGTAGA